ncbi:flavin-containing monooxygenase FMO GS-OX5 isoform X1 [Hippocampus comes]|uniref:flavin-containing monooxygenase FMO GS-OX5 isoform X1 n=1 Tax=Hippocampus comes TaxID=109280 RepID=UPI00094E5918|nr:PREDICTED: flavin-containing monooxygenase FMO GS-OX5-like isoform X1 [Hippocampus comes]
MAMELLRVAVIGAGAAGLCAARHVLSRPERFAPPVVFELTANVGGTWRYQERVGPDVRCSMYKNLRTNLPKEVMMFPDFPFNQQLNSFLSHQDVRRYLEDYCRQYRIRPHIRFHSAVEEVKPAVVTTEDGENRTRTTWEVTACDTSGCRTTATFDAVFVCSGHYSEPNIPSVPGLENFKGQVLHSHTYRSAEPFSSRSVVVLGAKASGIDISLELAKAGAQVTLSHRGPPLVAALPAEIRQSSPPVAVQDDGRICFQHVAFQDGSVRAADVLLFCTGYNFSFPFLDGGRLGLELEEQLVAPLYRFMMPPAFPSLVFIGLCKSICPFTNFHCQVQFALGALAGSPALPSRAQMAAEARLALQKKADGGAARRHLLVMGGDQWEYLAELAADTGFAPPPPVVRSLFEEVWRQRGLQPDSYRKLNYRLLNDTQWQVVDTA